MTENEYNNRLDAIEAKMAKEYVAQAAKVRGEITLAQILALIQSGNDIQAGVTVATAATYGPLLEESRTAFIKGGQDEAKALPKAVAPRPVEFDVRRPDAEYWLAQNARTFVTAQTQLQGEAVQLTLQAARAAAATPRQAAQQVLGVKSPVSGQVQGGVVGLHPQDAQFVANARAQLASGNPADMREYFQRVRRDKRFDGIVQRAITAGKPVAPADIDKIAQRYADRLLVTRADTVASIEALAAYNAGRNQLYNQLVEDGTPPGDITKRWKTRGDADVRETHRAMNGQTVPGNALFTSPSGARLLNPGDTTNGAPMSEVARCRCRAIYKVKGEA